jgi:hypothetical protein
MGQGVAAIVGAIIGGIKAAGEKQERDKQLRYQAMLRKNSPFTGRDGQYIPDTDGIGRIMQGASQGASFYNSNKDMFSSSPKPESSEVAFKIDQGSNIYDDMGTPWQNEATYGDKTPWDTPEKKEAGLWDKVVKYFSDEDKPQFNVEEEQYSKHPSQDEKDYKFWDKPEGWKDLSVPRQTAENLTPRERALYEAGQNDQHNAIMEAVKFWGK